jgi:hypothetical protein
MEKLAKQDLGLDLIGYKDYVNNIKRFAKYNTDLGILAEDNMFKDKDLDDPESHVFVDVQEGFGGSEKGSERAQQHGSRVRIAISKIMRPNNNLL